MMNALKHGAYAVAVTAAFSALTSTAFAGINSIGIVSLPIASGGLLGLAAAGVVVAGIWIRRRRHRR